MSQNLWDDLFRAAAGDHDIGETRTQTLANPSKRRRDSTSSETRPRKNNKRLKCKESPKNSQDLLGRILFSRADPIDRQIWSKLPSWLSPGSSLSSSTKCRGWEQNSDVSLESKCSNCKRTVLYHSLVVSPAISRKRKGVRKILTAFALVRDIRCCCSCFLNEFYTLNMEDKSAAADLDYYTTTAWNKSNELSNLDFSSVLTPGELDILIRKFKEVKNAASALRKKARQLADGRQESNGSFKPGGLFDKIVRLMICCDAVYYRMYYLQNAGKLLSILNEKVFLPHPPTYFGSNNVTWEVHDHTADLVKEMRRNHEHIGDDMWDKFLQEVGVTVSSRDSDPLTFLQKNRLSESILIFHKTSWIHSKETKEQFIGSIMCKLQQQDPETSFYATHETPAPKILGEWRDSCRDFLCNLYAYATISPKMIEDMKEIFLKKNIACKSVTEIGAGTGYVSQLFSRGLGLSVRAFDVAPTKADEGFYGDKNKSNEYHGSSPPFHRVEFADSQNLQSVFGHGKARETALLLCYPPPLSDMAWASLKCFMDHGGKTIIYIGEFHGLTGSWKFERFLSRHFGLKYRARCLNWGTDAAELTLWTKSEVPENKNSNVLAQCSRCKTSSAVWRLRMCRPLSYCKLPCFDAHRDERGLHFAFNMIPDVLNTNEMKSLGESQKERYFQPLSYQYNF